MARWDDKDARIRNRFWLVYHYIELNWSINRIAKFLGYKSSSVSSHMKKFGIKLRDKYERVPRGENHPNKRPEIRQKFSEINMGKQLSEITKQRISNTLSDPNITAWELLKIETKAKFGYTCCVCGISEDKCKQNLQLHHINYKPHYTYIINDIYDIESERCQLILVCSSCHTTIHFHLFEYYNLLSNQWINDSKSVFEILPLIKPSFGYHNKLDEQLTKKLLYNMYIEKGLSAFVISNAFDCSINKIYNYLRKFDIPIRTHSEAKLIKQYIFKE